MAGSVTLDSSAGASLAASDAGLAFGRRLRRPRPGPGLLVAARSASSSALRCLGGTDSGCVLDRMRRPSSTASAITRVSRSPERMASSLPGMTYWMTSGSQLVSTTATTGMPSLLASVTAMSSFLVSRMNTASGRRSRFRMPLRLRSSLSSSRVSRRASFLGMASNSPESRMRWYSFILPTRLEMVSKLVSMPPSQRWLMYGMPHFSA